MCGQNSKKAISFVRSILSDCVIISKTKKDKDLYRPEVHQTCYNFAVIL